VGAGRRVSRRTSLPGVVSSARVPSATRDYMRSRMFGAAPHQTFWTNDATKPALPAPPPALVLQMVCMAKGGGAEPVKIAKAVKGSAKQPPWFPDAKVSS
jgi:hypothetical protein